MVERYFLVRVNNLNYYYENKQLTANCQCTKRLGTCMKCIAEIVRGNLPDNIQDLKTYLVKNKVKVNRVGYKILFEMRHNDR